MAPTQRLHFQSLHLLSFFFICTLHWCEHCTVLEVAPNALKFPMTVLCGIAADGVVCSPVLVGTLFAPTQGSHFQALQPLNFLFTCALHWCKHCTVPEVTRNVRKFTMTALCVIAAQILICRLVLVGTLSATTHGLHFQAPHLLSFIFICTLHWYKHCTVLEETTNVRKFPITALFEIAEDGVVCGPILVDTLFAPTQRLHFQALHPLSFLFIST